MIEYIAVYMNGTSIAKEGPDANKFIFSLPGEYFVFLRDNNANPDYGINVHYLNKDSKKDKLIVGEYEFINFKFRAQSTWVITIFEKKSQKVFELTINDYQLKTALGKIVKTLVDLSSFESFDAYKLKLHNENEFENLKKENALLKEEIIKLNSQLVNVKQN